jgi:Tfp pilus assembly protein PilW
VRNVKGKGLGLVELLVAIAVGAAVMGAAFLALRQTARGLSTEQKIALSQDQAARVLQGLSGELKDRPAAFLLPGASE